MKHLPLLFLISCAAPSFPQALIPARATEQSLSMHIGPSAARLVFAVECCKHTKGKPCGDTCIESSDICHVGVGCACTGPKP